MGILTVKRYLLRLNNWGSALSVIGLIGLCYWNKYKRTLKFYEIIKVVSKLKILLVKQKIYGLQISKFTNLSTKNGY